MAISITSNLNLIDNASSTTGWTFDANFKNGASQSVIFREGGSSIEGQIGQNLSGHAYHTHGSSINATTAGNERVYVWMAGPSGLGTLAQGGFRVVIGDGTNARAYYVGGSDEWPFSYGPWVCLMLDTANLPTSYAQITGSGAPSLTALTQFGGGVYNLTKVVGKAPNVYIDVVRYGSGITVTSGATDNITFANIVAQDDNTSNAYGIIRQIQPGVYGVQGDILLGDTGSNSIDFKDSDAVVVFEDRVAGSGTNTKFQFSGQHNATGTFGLELGVAVGSGDDEAGRSGVIFVSASASQPVDIDFSDTNIEDVFLYGCTLTNIKGGTIAFSADATNGVSHHISGTSFSGCSQVDPGRTVIRNCTFANTESTTGALLWNANINIKQSQFLGNTTGEGIEHDTIESVHTGTAASGSNTTTLVDTGFTANVAVNDYVYNEVTGGYAKVTSVDSNTSLTHETLSTGTWTIGNAYSISPAITYTDLTFSGNTNDVTNSATGSDALFISKSGTANPTTSTGTAVFIGSVPVSFESVDKNDAALQSVRITAYLVSDNTEVINTTTTAGGLAETTFSGTTPADIYYRYRKSSTGSTKYVNLSGFATIESGTGVSVKRSMTVDTTADPSI